MRVRMHNRRLGFGPEPLETRDMLSANGLVSASHLASHAAAAAASQAQYLSSTVAGASLANLACHAQTSLSTTLADPANSSASGTVTYTLSRGSSHGNPTTNLNVSVSGTTANATLNVAIDGVQIGQINTDASGAGSLALSSNPTGNQQALPANFPTDVSADSVITVGTLTGSLASTHVSHETR